MVTPGNVIGQATLDEMNYVECAVDQICCKTVSTKMHLRSK
jgi:hypothetical protein